MKQVLYTRRGVLGTLFFSGVSIPFLKGNPIPSNIGEITWIDGCFLPRPNSNSFDSAKSNVLIAIKSNLREFNSPQKTFEFSSELPDDSTVESLLIQKQHEGLVSLEIQAFDGMGVFIKNINGFSNDYRNDHYWKFKVNGAISQNGISQTKINKGDTVSFILGSAFNDKIVFEDSLGDYSKLLLPDSIPMWDGKILTDAFWPLEYGNVRYEFCKITAPDKSYFIPQNVKCLRYIERWDSSVQKWVEVSNVTISITASDFIGQSFNGSQETRFEQPSTSMIFGGTGIGFPPSMQGGTEMSRLVNRLSWLKENRIRVRIQIETPIIGSDGSSSKVTEEKITLKQHIPFPQDVQTLTIPTSGLLIFNAPDGEENLLYEVEQSSDLKKWTPLDWMNGKPFKEIDTPKGVKLFFRTRRF